MKIKLQLETASGNTFREEIIEVSKDFTKSEELIKLFEELSSEAAKKTIEMEEEMHMDSCYLEIYAISDCSASDLIAVKKHLNIL